MNRLYPLADKEEKLAIGLMSGTSTDGVDAVLVSIKGFYTSTKVKELGFISIPYTEEVRERLLVLMKGEEGGSREIMEMSFLLGEIFTETALALCERCKVSRNEIDFISSHGHTVYHQPSEDEYLGHKIRGTMQIGDVSRLAETFSCPVISDFRVRDFAKGGMGAPLVPYTEFILFSDEERNVGYQNIGGIGNVTILKKKGREEDVYAFDTGPGNALIDLMITHYTNGRERYDEGGARAAKGSLHPALKEFFLKDKYVASPPPKTTGREYYSEEYASSILSIAEKEHIKEEDVLYSVTWFTAYAIKEGVKSSCLDRLVVAGGGSHNRTLLSCLRSLLPETEIVTASELGINSDSKEAVAFAILGNETLHGHYNVLPGATGASEPSVLGKIQL